MTNLNLTAVIAGVLISVNLPSFVSAHGNKPGSSSIEIGGGEVKVDFVGPESKGRDVLSLLPADAYWRMGADRPTTLTSNVALRFGDSIVPSGTFTLVAYFSEDGGWSLVIADELGSGFRPVNIIGRVDGIVSKREVEAENMVIALEEGEGRGLFVLDWGMARLTAEFFVD